MLIDNRLNSFHFDRNVKLLLEVKFCKHFMSASGLVVRLSDSKLSGYGSKFESHSAHLLTVYSVQLGLLPLAGREMSSGLRATG